MPTSHTPEPFEGTPHGPGSAADEPDVARGSADDLAAVPAFLRGRERASISRPARSVGVREAVAAVPDAAALPMAGIAPRKLVIVGATIVLAWLLISFSRQVAEASAASSRAGGLRAANAVLSVEVAAMERELQLIQEPRYIAQAARAFRLGTAHEVPFALQADAPPLAADAPGSASVRLGAEASSRSPIETWLEVLFGPDR